MQKKIMYVFFGEDCLPYKDQARTVHYPLLGSTFTGASDTTEIRFFVDRIGGIYQPTWIANTKLPNGKKGYKLLTSGRDSDFNENYVSLSLSQFYTQVKGDIYISLNGYNGGITLTQDDDDNYILIGTPTIQTTGCIKITMQYAVQLLESDIYEYISLDDILGYISGLASDDYVNQFFQHKVVLENNDSAYQDDLITWLLEKDLIQGLDGETFAFALFRFTELNRYRMYLVNGAIQYWSNKSLEISIVEWPLTNNSNIKHYAERIINANTVLVSTELTNFDNNCVEIPNKNEVALLSEDNEFTGSNTFEVVDVNDTISGHNVWFKNLGSDEGGTFAHYDDDNYDYDIRKLSSITFNGSLNDLPFAQGYNPNLPDSHLFTEIKLLNIATPVNETDGVNKSYVDNLVSTIKQDNIVVVDTTEYETLDDFLASTGEEGDIYLYPIDTTDSSKGYYRYVWENNSWLPLGTTEIDLSDYATLSDLGNYYTKTEVNSWFTPITIDED